MEQVNSKKTKSEVLSEIRAAHDLRHRRASELLQNIKDNRNRIEALLDSFKRSEPDLVYRFYHQSFKVFGMVQKIRDANKLFSDLAPETTFLNQWYVKITRTALAKKFEGSDTNHRWLETTLPVMQAFWHAKYFLEQMLIAADELDEAPQILPSGWAAVLYLYDLR
jgi:hypothetical protein